MIARICRIACLPLLLLAAASSAQVTAAPTGRVAVAGHVKVLEPRVRVAIDSPPVTFTTGQHAPLFQENEEFFVALVDSPSGGKRLCAFPLQTREGPSAWISKEHELFFAYTTASCRGRMYLREGEQLPVIGETATDYEVVIERLGRRAKLAVPKHLRSIEFVKAAPPPKKVVRAAPVIKPAPRPAPPTPPEPTTNAPAPEPTAPTAPPAAEPEETSLLQQWIAAALSRLMGAEPETPAPTAPAPAPSTTSAAPPAAASGTTAVAPGEQPAAADEFAQPAEGAEEPKTGGGYPSLAMILVLLAVISAGLYLNHRRRRKSAPAPAAEAAPGPLPPEPEAPTGVSEEDGHGDFSGSISSVPLSSVAQFLNANKETGMLDVKDPSGAHVGALIFMAGNILDAHAKGKRGVGAVYDILRKKEGSFAFVRTQELPRQQTIHENTITLLLNANKQMDEETSGAGP